MARTMEKKGKFCARAIMGSRPPLILLVLLFDPGGNLVQIQGAVAPVQPDGQGQHQRRHGHGDDNARQHQSAGHRIDVGVHILHAVYHNGSRPAQDIAFLGQEQVDGRVHDVQANDFFNQIPLQQQVGKADAEQNHCDGLAVVGKQIAAQHQKPPFRNSA